MLRIVLTICVLISNLFCGVLTQKTSSKELRAPELSDEQLTQKKIKQAHYVNDVGHYIMDTLATSSHTIFLSPFSIHTVLMLLGHGATGETELLLRSFLRIPSEEAKITLAEIQISLTKALIHSNSQPLYLLANSIWINDHFDVYQQYISDCSEAFNATAKLVNFGDIETASMINSWVKNSTNGLIENAVEQTNIEDKIILINTLYFKQRWDYPFDPSKTKLQTFFLLNGEKKEVEMMEKNEEMLYVENKDVRAISISFRDKRAQFIVFLPNQRDFESMQRCISKYIEADWLNSVVRSMAMRRMNVQLPKMKISQETKLKDTLSKLGIRNIFTKAANFSNISPGFFENDGNESLKAREGERDEEEKANLYVSDIVHHAVLDVNELGIEAAAATITYSNSAEEKEEQKGIDFVVNRPFIVAIVEKDANLILFEGAIMDPVNVAQSSSSSNRKNAHIYKQLQEKYEKQEL
ncbi:putative Serpin (serine protease inhibitor) [Monocercomonoides exilis]|uniref:putative Serpin (serine protease inhibitor) n=1 Tax=Monocercomonoides exilis TaxID=2049356 RepID=UPI003559D066|nr:putative Serpin (serine protease inhibitor) [Monocercomonoides exilis]